MREVVLCPGSRNAPLSFAVHDAARADLLRLHTRVDERTAGFLALGLTKVGARAAVVCTSGTAVANLLPAVMESAHSGLDLVVVTADRPARMRGTGANQTTDQVGVFGAFAPTTVLEAGGPALGDVLSGTDGPVHLNVHLDDPLIPEGPWTDVAADSWAMSWDDRAEPVELPPGPRTVVVAGDDAGPPARVLAQDAGWPLLAEPTSGSRTGDHAIRTYRLLLGSDLGDRDRAGRRGRAPHAVAPRHPAARARGRRGRLDALRGASGRRGRSRSARRPTGTPQRPATRPGSTSGARPTGRSAASSTGCSPRSPTSRRTRSPVRSAGHCRPEGCCTSAPPARSATWT